MLLFVGGDNAGGGVVTSILPLDEGYISLVLLELLFVGAEYFVGGATFTFTTSGEIFGYLLVPE
jgi:hypothetical protein